MILRRVICDSISPAHSRTRNETTLASQISVGYSFKEREALKRDEHNAEPFDAILRGASAPSPGPATPECADPEVIAAYYDHSLLESERDLLEAHFADCARCQTQLAAIARADERAGEARPALGITWLQRWQVAIPAFAAVATVVVVIAVMRSRSDESHRDFQIAMAKREAPMMDLAERAPAPASPPASEVASAPDAATNALATNEAKPVAPGAGERRAERHQGYAAETRGRAGALAGDQRTKSLAANTHGLDAGGAGRAIGIGGAVAARETLVMISPPERPAISAQTTSAPPSVANGRAASATGALAAPAAAPMGAIASNSIRQRGPTWMAGKRGTILFRGADGDTRPQHSGVDVDLTAGAAPSATVCWIVGRKGTIVRTIDGENWTKIASPSDADLTAVSAESAERAIVTTASGQNFATSDGGTSWYRQ
jgi:hypothetical protein